MGLPLQPELKPWTRRLIPNLILAKSNTGQSKIYYSHCGKEDEMKRASYRKLRIVGGWVVWLAKLWIQWLKSAL